MFQRASYTILSSSKLVRSSNAAKRAIASSSSSSSSAAAASSSSSSVAGVLYSDNTIKQNQIYHKSSILSMALLPIAALAHPSPLSIPVDAVCAVVFPLHAHFGMSWIITDYLQGAIDLPSRLILLFCTVGTTLGLLHLTFFGPGIIGTIKETWTGAEHEKKQKKSA